MNQKVVTMLPLSELWNEAGTAKAAWQRDLCKADIRSLLSNGDVRFVVADIGKVLRWIAMSETYRFWKENVQPRLQEGQKVHLEDYQDGYYYWASQWQVDNEPPIILLSVSH